MDIDKLRELLKIVADSGVSEVEIEEDDFRLVVRKDPASVMVQPSAPPFGMPYPPYPTPAIAPLGVPPTAPPPAPAGSPMPPAANTAQETEPAPSDQGTLVHAPIVGTFYTRPAPDADTYVNVGETVKPGDILCIIEAMKLMNEIECEVTGTVRQILVEDAQPVEFDQPLFIIDA